LFLNVTAEISTSECRPSSLLYGCALNRARVLSAVCVAPNLPITGREDAELAGDFQTQSYAMLVKKKHVVGGDYQQPKGRRSEITIPSGKLFGLRKFDLIATPKGIGLVKEKRSTGYFFVEGVSNSVNIKKNVTRITARCSSLIEILTIGAANSSPTSPRSGYPSLKF
jgi:hypothetical protein